MNPKNYKLLELFTLNSTIAGTASCCDRVDRSKKFNIITNSVKSAKNGNDRLKAFARKKERFYVECNEQNAKQIEIIFPVDSHLDSIPDFHIEKRINKRLKAQPPTGTRLWNACQCALINQASHV